MACRKAAESVAEMVDSWAALMAGQLVDSRASWWVALMAYLTVGLKTAVMAQMLAVSLVGLKAKPKVGRLGTWVLKTVAMMVGWKVQITADEKAVTTVCGMVVKLVLSTDNSKVYSMVGEWVDQMGPWWVAVLVDSTAKRTVGRLDPWVLKTALMTADGKAQMMADRKAVMAARTGGTKAVRKVAPMDASSAGWTVGSTAGSLVEW